MRMNENQEKTNQKICRGIVVGIILKREAKGSGNDGLKGHYSPTSRKGTASGPEKAKCPFK